MTSYSIRFRVVITVFQSALMGLFDQVTTMLVVRHGNICVA